MVICYKDMTFCEFYKDCKDGKECYRSLTKEINKKAEEWMKNPPIMVFSEKPDCWEKK